MYISVALELAKSKRNGASQNKAEKNWRCPILRDKVLEIMFTSVTKCLSDAKVKLEFYPSSRNQLLGIRRNFVIPT